MTDVRREEPSDGWSQHARYRPDGVWDAEQNSCIPTIMDTYTLCLWYKKRPAKVSRILCSPVINFISQTI